jgi:glycosyltransferase involved in cell wall biosynthesis
MPTVSVIIPAYNRADLMGRAITSVLAQTFTDYELLVVDDGSTDNTKEAVATFGDRIKYLRHGINSGLSSALNTGIRGSTGEFVAFLESDDEWHPFKLQLQVERFRAGNPRLGLVYGAMASVDTRTGKSLIPPTPWLPDNILDTILYQNCVLGGGSLAMIPRRCLDEVGLFDTAIRGCQDWDMWIRIAERYEVDCVPQVLATIYTHGGSNSQNIPPMIKGFESLMEKHHALYEARPRIQADLHYLLGRYWLNLGMKKEARPHFSSAFRTASGLDRMRAAKSAFRWLQTF